MIRELLPVLGIGLVIGFRHAFEPDHMAAVTTLAGRHARLRDAWRLSLAWTAGHTATIALVTAAVIALGWRLPGAVLAGVRSWPWRCCSWASAHRSSCAPCAACWHLHAHAHGGDAAHARAQPCAQRRPRTRAPAPDGRWALGFGLMHGLAGSGAVIRVDRRRHATRLAQWGCLGAFALGTMLGMLVVASSLWGLVRVASTRGAAWIVRLRLGSRVRERRRGHVRRRPHARALSVAAGRGCTLRPP